MAQGRLERSFPGRAMQLAADLFTDSEFSRELVGFLYGLHSEKKDEVMPEYQKANVQAVEERDTVDPQIVTHSWPSSRLTGDLSDFVLLKSIFGTMYSGTD